MKYIIGNWKANPKSLAEAKDIVSAVKKISKNALSNNIQPVICPPYLYVSSLIDNKNTKLQFGAQDIWINNDTAETGMVTASLCKNVGLKYVIVGHSECRRRGDDNETVSIKLSHAALNGLKVILCVGELKRDHNGLYFNQVAKQLRESLSNFPENKISNLIIAYEPVWAIGEDAESAATPKDFYEMAMLIRRTLAEQFTKEKAFSVPLIYGGSVDKKNAQSFIDVGSDGLLIGRSSLKAKDFISIIDKTIISKNKIK